MKKQILFLTLFVATILGGMNAYGQDPTVEYDDALTTVPGCITPTTLTCFGTASALTPVAGREYTYTITSEDTDAANNTEKVHWFVVDNADLATTGIINGTGTAPDMSHLTALIDPADGSEWLVSAETGVYNIPVTETSPNTADEISLTWNYFDGQNNVILLVAYVYDAVNCTNNIEVYRIFPQIQFTLDIAAIDQDEGTVNGPDDVVADECVSPIESASYAVGAADPASPGEGLLTVDYGENYAYFMVNAANFTGAWNPLFDFTYTGVGSIVSADWAYPAAADNNAATAWNAINFPTGADGHTITDATSTPIIAGGGDTDGAAINTVAALDTVGVLGECIVVRVRIDHGTSAENTVLRTLTVTVDGTMYDPTATDPADAYANTSLEDFGPNASGTGTACEQVDNDDVISFNITPRPNIITTDPTPFEQNTGDNSGTTPFTPVTPNTGSSTN
ncbi:hypothetical protein [Draconibacterium orientale]|uniref:hypothetical protein n=1 Tax=Draconibacterium orientale TaxID=1168034 RepID=UPI0029BFE971|nr:hypothetical protein [Draconibacterium orientale]